MQQSRPLDEHPRATIMKSIALALGVGLATFGLAGNASAHPPGYGGGNNNGFNRGYSGGYGGNGNYQRGYNQGNFNRGYAGPAYSPSYRPSYGYAPYRAYPSYVVPQYGYQQPGLSFGFNFFR
jgi:hypothetical protein